MNLTIIGTGIRIHQDLSLEGLAVIKNADKVLYSHFDDSDLKQFFEQYGVADFESIASLYVDGAIDIDIYSNIILKLIKETKGHKNVVYLVDGHPRFGESITQELENGLADSEIDLKVIGGYSSFDSLLNVVKVDAIEKGSMVVDANRLILFEYSIDPLVDLYIFNVGSIGVIEAEYKEPWKSNNPQFLQQYLKSFYPNDHEIKLIVAANIENCDTIVKNLKLNELEASVKSLTFNCTIYIPGLMPNYVNGEFYGILEGE